MQSSDTTRRPGFTAGIDALAIVEFPTNGLSSCVDMVPAEAAYLEYLKFFTKSGMSIPGRNFGSGTGGA